MRVCSQYAKQVRNTTDQVRELLASDRRVAACLAPSFPAEFTDCEPEQLVGMMRMLGFDLVQEVSFGADLVAREYRRLLAVPDGQRYIATTCPAITTYVEKYLPELVECLVPVVSPMIATARALRQIHGESLAVVFIGPCIAKKVEAETVEEIEAVLTFTELRQNAAEAGHSSR